MGLQTWKNAPDGRVLLSDTEDNWFCERSGFTIIDANCKLFSHAEAGEDGAEDFVGGYFSGDGAEVVEGVA